MLIIAVKIVNVGRVFTLNVAHQKMHPATARKRKGKASVHKKSIYSNKAMVWVLALHYDLISVMLQGFRLAIAFAQTKYSV